MSQALQQIYASASGLVHHTLELKNSAFLVPNHPQGRILFCQGFDDVTAGLETGEIVTFCASGFGVSLPVRSMKGKQDLQFQLDNVTGEALQAIKAAKESGEKIEVIYRPYSDSDLTAPGENPYRMTAISVSAKGASVQVVASFSDLVNRAWPKRRYTPSFAPGLTYFG
jgi:hypothetical protein